MRVAVVQIDPHLADPVYNLGLIAEGLSRAQGAGAELAVFPECAVSGYLYTSLAEALEIAEPIPGTSSDRIAELAARDGIYTVAGMLERDGDRCYNTAVIAGPHGLI